MHLRTGPALRKIIISLRTRHPWYPFQVMSVIYPDRCGLSLLSDFVFDCIERCEERAAIETNGQMVAVALTGSDILC